MNGNAGSPAPAANSQREPRLHRWSRSVDECSMRSVCVGRSGAACSTGSPMQRVIRPERARDQRRALFRDLDALERAGKGRRRRVEQSAAISVGHEVHLFAGTSSMARPGLEPGTPRFSVVGRNLSTSPPCRARPPRSRSVGALRWTRLPRSSGRGRPTTQEHNEMTQVTSESSGTTPSATCAQSDPRRKLTGSDRGHGGAG